MARHQAATQDSYQIERSAAAHLQKAQKSKSTSLDSIVRILTARRALFNTTLNHGAYLAKGLQITKPEMLTCSMMGREVNPSTWADVGSVRCRCRETHIVELISSFFCIVQPVFVQLCIRLCVIIRSPCKKASHLASLYQATSVLNVMKSLSQVNSTIHSWIWLEKMRMSELLEVAPPEEEPPASASAIKVRTMSTIAGSLGPGRQGVPNFQHKIQWSWNERYRHPVFWSTSQQARKWSPPMKKGSILSL